MGDRANVFIPDYSGDSGVYLYAHWDGTELPLIVKDALDSEAGRNRWGDGQYLARIIFCKMMCNAIDEEIGYGLSGVVCDGADRILSVCPITKFVSFGKKAWTFEEFCTLTNEELHTVWEK